MKSMFQQVDRILRGDATRLEDIERDGIQFPIFRVVFVIWLLASAYGICMGVFAVIRGFESQQLQETYMQMVANICKVPLLFFLTLLITFPSLYVFNALVGSQLKVGSVLKLLIASLAVNLAVLSSLGPIVAFFSACTPNYPFIVLLNVAVFAVAGFLGLVFLIQTLNRMAVSGNLPRDERIKVDRDQSATGVPSEQSELPPSDSTSEVITASTSGPLEKVRGVTLAKHVKTVFACWVVIFGLVGAQMGWVLRPFIGNPNAPFQWFRHRESNFFEAVSRVIQSFFF